MELNDNMSLNKLRLSSKRLKSGRVQVKFQMSINNYQNQYGYLLTEPKASLKDVVAKILQSFDCGISVSSQRHLYSIGRQKQTTEMLIFR